MLPRENYWYHKHRHSKDLVMENAEEEDSFAKDMRDLNNFAD